MIYRYSNKKYLFTLFLSFFYCWGIAVPTYANNFLYVNKANEKPICLTVTILQDQIKYSCPQQNNGKLNIKIKGGIAPYYVFWEDERGNVGGPLTTVDSLAEIPNLAPRTYTFEVFDNGIGNDRCFSGLQGPFDMVNARFEVATDLLAAPKCHGDANGQLKAAVNLNGIIIENVDAYQFIWQNTVQDTVATDPQAINLTTGNYRLTAFTNNGCMATSSIELPEPQPLKINDRQIAPAFCSDSENGAIQLNNISGGTGEPTVIWAAYPNETSRTLSNLKPATYHFTIQDENACSLTDSATITAQMKLELDLVQDQSRLKTTCYDSEDATITIALKDNVPTAITQQLNRPYQFEWSANAPLAKHEFDRSTIHNVGVDTFELRVSHLDLHGCSTAFSVETIRPTPLSLDSTNLVYRSPNCITPFSGSAAIEVLGGTPNYRFN